MIHRRAILGFLACAPAIVRAPSLMALPRRWSGTVAVRDIIYAEAAFITSFTDVTAWLYLTPAIEELYLKIYAGEGQIKYVQEHA